MKETKVKDKKEKPHYVNNKEFYEKISEYKASILKAEKEGKEKPKVSNYLGECFVKIANHLAYKSNFVNYTFRDEMILDGIENCITYIDNFNPEKSKNPFAYFTQITYYAFLRRIQKEKKQMETKYKYIQSQDIESMLQGDGVSDTNQEYLDWMRSQVDEAQRFHQEQQKQNTTPKRRPKYFDDKEALKRAKEELPKFKEMVE
jgi:DNA-directed RNA polymerase specialized sigma24 family protein